MDGKYLVWRLIGLSVVGAGLVFQLVEAGRGPSPGPLTWLLVTTVAALAVSSVVRRWLPRVAVVTGWAAAVLLGLDFAGAVADRFGAFGGPGTMAVSWGSWPVFVAYTEQLLPDAVAGAAPAAAVVATAAEVALAVLLVSGWRRPLAGAAAALLLSVYLATMAVSLGWPAVAQFAVPVLIGGAVLVAVSPLRRPHRDRLPASAGLVGGGPAVPPPWSPQTSGGQRRSR